MGKYSDILFGTTKEKPPVTKVVFKKPTPATAVSYFTAGALSWATDPLASEYAKAKERAALGGPIATSRSVL